MDATAGDKRKAQPPSDGSPAPTSAPEVRDVDVPLCEQAVAADGGGEDDEEVDRFYALLANIRALRDLYGGGGGSSKKRARRSTEPPWRPAFRLEDFRDADDAARPTKKERREDDDVGRQRPEDDAAAEDGEVVEEKGRVSPSQRARVLTS